MIGALICVALAAAVVGINGADHNWLSLVLCGLGLWFLFRSWSQVR